MTFAPLFLILAAALHAPEECLVTSGKPAATIEHNGRTYGLRFADCKDEFLTDPERFAQLYDALLEMHEAGMELAAPRESLVPS